MTLAQKIRERMNDSFAWVHAVSLTNISYNMCVACMHALLVCMPDAKGMQYSCSRKAGGTLAYASTAA